eukprot:4205208-Prymnesium_polylepis.1
MEQVRVRARRCGKPQPARERTQKGAPADCDRLLQVNGLITSHRVAGLARRRPRDGRGSRRSM